MPEARHEESSMLRTHNSGVTHETHCYQAIMLKILGATIKNLVIQVTRHPGFVYHCFGIHLLVMFAKFLLLHLYQCNPM